MVNKKYLTIFFVVLAVCIVVGVLLGVFLSKKETNNPDSWELPESSPWYGNEEIRLFREYLRFPTVHPNINYEPCVQFLRRQAESLNLPISVVYPANDKNPVVIITWTGSEPNLPSIMLNSHTDVVPVYEDMWTHPPFAADVDDDGKIIARGTQDTKSLGVTYLAAIRALKLEGEKSLRRTIHVTFVPDEETGGAQGMAAFVLSDTFKAMNVGFALDEAGVSPTNVISVYNDERCPWQIEFICNGPTGHASILYEDTAGEKISYVVSKLMEMRKMELERMKNESLPYGKVTTINLTILKGGIQANVIPPELRATFDIRLSVDVDHEEFEAQLNRWCEEAGGNITINFIVKTPKAPPSTADSTNPVWVVLQNTTKELGMDVVPTILAGATDMRFLRRLNIPAFGFSPLINTPILLHDHNEFVHADEYLAGIKLYTNMLRKLGNI
ncbi:Aminoacylase-1 [Pseudolycoriella hygida]|uniref:N-acyl-aliphatic-L-amino acid amidohydrolase n=1 Tax=Pseudolycoriella hygida TaxID=35572 RepID=A0A9Q0N6G8_9DIPT|nr:Aminoacylase-1 [Pseudolycoriella hygida]